MRSRLGLPPIAVRIPRDTLAAPVHAFGVVGKPSKKLGGMEPRPVPSLGRWGRFQRVPPAIPPPPTVRAVWKAVSRLPAAIGRRKRSPEASPARFGGGHGSIGGDGRGRNCRFSESGAPQVRSQLGSGFIFLPANERSNAFEISIGVFLPRIQFRWTNVSGLFCFAFL
jgi:hypothetical protein